MRDHSRIKVLCTQSVQLMQLLRRFRRQILAMTIVQPLFASLRVRREAEEWRGVFGSPSLVITVRCGAAVSHFGLQCF